ncbi:MAG: serine/threonine-protein kinase [Candidatus Promineifilaceae bacterium]|nr:serine/threonine-protein kinase [Candidatus Promineifilaceae bacterium]
MLQGRYRIVGTLGMGGFSSVYQARDMRFSNVTKLCAVKEMIHVAPNDAVRVLATQSFEREANILATLDHPAIVGVYDYFTEENRSYLVLEFIRGKDLESLLSEQVDFFPERQVLDWAFQVCDVLAYLHAHRPEPIVFRDMKPSNVMLDPHGRIRLIDFGIAKVFQSEGKNTTIGTEGYAPPEQYRGEASPAGDVYGLGATLHHLLTRQDPRLEPPFSFHERPIRAANPDVSPALAEVVMRCVNYSVGERYQSAGELKEALLEVAQQTGFSNASVGTLEQSRLSPRHGQQVPEETERTADPQAGARAQSGRESMHAGSERGAPAQSASSDEVSPLWSFKCEDEIRSRPAVDSGMVYVGAYDNNLYALDRQSGAFRWKYAAADGIASSPTIYEGVLFTGSVDNHLYAINSATGRLSWRFLTGGPIYSSPAAHFDHIFFGSDDNHLYVVNVYSGRAAWKSDAASPVRSSPLVTDDHVYFGTEAGYVYCLNLSGEQKWQFQARRAVTSTPAVADDLVFFGSVDSTIYAVDAGSGWAIWRFRTRRPTISSPVIHDGILYIGSADHTLYAIDISSGRQIWSYESGGQIASSPAVWHDTVCFGSTDGAVYALDTKRGKLQWRFQTQAMVISSPVIKDGVVYIGSADHRLYALPV